MANINWRDTTNVIAHLVKQRIESELKETLRLKLEEIEKEIPAYLIEISATAELNHMIDEMAKKYVININTIIK